MALGRNIECSPAEGCLGPWLSNIRSRDVNVDKYPSACDCSINIPSCNESSAQSVKKCRLKHIRHQLNPTTSTRLQRHRCIMRDAALRDTRNNDLITTYSSISSLFAATLTKLSTYCFCPRLQSLMPGSRQKRHYKTRWHEKQALVLGGKYRSTINRLIDFPRFAKIRCIPQH